mmetsp:Transcript_52040/g.123134  ORF Transcript_52040/g.123134 Transcript_52040/m.123134 type:complete len:225 (+) Transcript_52040:3049-3723(+)
MPRRGRCKQCRLSFLVSVVHIGAVSEQRLHRLDPIERRRRRQRKLPLLGRLVHVDACPCQQVHRAASIPGRRSIHRRRPPHVRGGRVTASRDQEADDAVRPCCGGREDRRASVLAAAVGIGASSKQQLHLWQLALPRCLRQRGVRARALLVRRNQLVNLSDRPHQPARHHQTLCLFLRELLFWKRSKDLMQYDASDNHPDNRLPPFLNQASLLLLPSWDLRRPS